jgi:hypothetical protein
MRIARRQPIEMLTISALDIFASALGVFVLISILLFPFYLRQPSIEVAQAGAEAELAAAGEALEQRARAVAEAERRRASAEAAITAARQRLEEAESAAAQAETAAAPPSPSPESRGARLAIKDLDLVFVLDTTGSMRQEIADLQANLIGIIRVLSRLAGSLRVGLVAFKDRGDEYLTQAFPLRPMTGGDAAALVDFVGRLSAEGGGDDPEPVDEALRAALDMPWRPDAQGQIIVIGDAPAHGHRVRQTMELAGQFRRNAGQAAPRMLSAILTGGDPGARAFYERLAAAGGGRLALHQGQMIESVLLSVLDGGAGRSEAQ